MPQSKISFFSKAFDFVTSIFSSGQNLLIVAALFIFVALLGSISILEAQNQALQIKIEEVFISNSRLTLNNESLADELIDTSNELDSLASQLEKERAIFKNRQLSFDNINMSLNKKIMKLEKGAKEHETESNRCLTVSLPLDVAKLLDPKAN